MMKSRDEREMIQRVSTIFGIRSTGTLSNWVFEPPEPEAAGASPVILEDLINLDAQGVGDLDALEVPARGVA
jgi:hypothetical protein